jgi:hypothetical protein
MARMSVARTPFSQKGLGSAVALLILAIGCGTTSSPGTTGDAGGTPPPSDGGGVCCPITGTPPCDCAGGGGWAESTTACNKPAVCDLYFDVVNDAHGCPSLVRGQGCCGCPPDAGKDGEGDAPDVSDASDSGECSSPSDCRTFSDYCGTCKCDALRKDRPSPTCDGGTVACFVDPCMGYKATCDVLNHCILQ